MPQTASVVIAMQSKTIKATLVFLNLLIIFGFGVFGEIIYNFNRNGRLMARVSSRTYEETECPESDNGKSFKDPDKCGVYYNCTYRPLDSKYILDPITCSNNTSYDEVAQICSETQLCPQIMPAELTLPSGWRCDKNGFQNADPSDCRKYYTCNDCESPEHLGQTCYTSDTCADTEYFDNYEMSCVPSTNCPQDRLELPIDERWQCEEDDELHMDPTDCSKYYSCHRCSSSCRGWCYDMHQCSPEGYHFDETQKKCVSEGECNIKPTGPPPDVEDRKCDRNHKHDRWPDESNCQCYYECTRIFIPFLPYVYENRHYCCDDGSYDPVGKKCSEEICCDRLSSTNAKTYYAYKNLIMTNKASQ